MNIISNISGAVVSAASATAGALASATGNAARTAGNRIMQTASNTTGAIASTITSQVSDVKDYALGITNLRDLKECYNADQFHEVVSGGNGKHTQIDYVPSVMQRGWAMGMELGGFAVKNIFHGIYLAGGATLAAEKLGIADSADQSTSFSTISNLTQPIFNGTNAAICMATNTTMGAAKLANEYVIVPGYNHVVVPYVKSVVVPVLSGAAEIVKNNPLNTTVGVAATALVYSGYRNFKVAGKRPKNKPFVNGREHGTIQGKTLGCADKMKLRVVGTLKIVAAAALVGGAVMLNSLSEESKPQGLLGTGQVDVLGTSPMNPFAAENTSFFDPNGFTQDDFFGNRTISWIGSVSTI